MNFNLKIDKKTAKYFQKTMPHKLTEAKNRAVEAMGKVWADETKELTRNEGHIQTGLYVNSIGYNTGSPASDGDVIHKIVDKNGKTILETGSNVAYAGYLEKKFNLMARGLDVSSNRMQKVAKTQIKDTLFG
ncbi:HK97 gp10 family phage protein [Heyndrickxia coagulans]|uniref:HK97 gp10 family phage protein n=1 Tax=Heyndrickxia coagulans TaxID=1398 RepID=UPI0013785ABE|nr:HK97 gp10 family phage protein [Heyndrickxia coagulans]